MKAFIGFEYNKYFELLFEGDITPWLSNKSVESIYPINKIPGGILIDRILSMIESCNLTIWECTTINPNVIFELGYSLGIRKPFFILYNKQFNEASDLPLLLKTQWGLWYNNSSELKTKLENVISINYAIGKYDHRNNELFDDTQQIISKINSIGIITDSTHNYDYEFKILYKHYKGTKIDLIDIELYGNISHFFNDIETKSMLICILSKIDEELSPTQKVNKTINALKLLALGIAHGLGKKVLILQRGSNTYSDIDSLVKFYNNEKEFETNLRIWNTEIVELDFREKFTSTRIRVPNLGKLIQRNHITEFIKGHLFSKYIFLRAPSGYGKTAIILNLIQSREYKTIWFACDNRIKDIVEVIKDILAEINKFQNNVGKSISAFIFSFYKGDMSNIDLINYFILELKSIKEKVVIIIDDIHNLNNKQFSDFFDLIFETYIENIGFIFIGREEIEIDHPENLINNCITLNKQDVEFKENEIKKYFEEILSINLSNEELHLLTSKSEGWIASISLFQTIVIQKGSDVVKNIIENLKGNKKRIYDYFADIVYDYFDKNTQNYLKLISIPFKLTANDVSFILELSRIDSLSLLNELEVQNSFLFSYENDPLIFKFHSLFREFLLKKFEEEDGVDKLVQCKNDLANYYFENKDYFESVIFGIEGKNFEIAVRTIDYIGNDLINEGMGEFIYELTQKIPEQSYNDDYSFLIIKGRTEEFFSTRSLSMQTYIKARNILKSRREKKREFNLVDFFILQLEIYQNTDKTYMPDKLKQIIEESNRENDMEIYSFAFGLYSQIKRISLMIKPNMNREINQKVNEEFITEIDRAIYKIENSNLNGKNLYISQLLIDKAMISHSLSWYNALQSVTMNRLSSIFHVEISESKKNEIENDCSVFFAQEVECFERAMKIANDEHNLRLKANILVNRSETFDSRNNFFAFAYHFVSEELANKSLTDLNNALIIYQSNKNIHGIATVYNNAAQTYLLKDDKQNRDKYADLAINLATEFGYNEIIKSAKDIMNSPSISETIRNNIKLMNREMEDGLTEENENKVIENWIGMLDNISDEERANRIQIFKLQMRNVKMQKTLIGNWCKHINVFHTNLPLRKHDDTSISMVRSYMDYDEKAQEAHKLSKQMQIDFSESLAIFIYCKHFNYHSDKLYDEVELSSNEFIAKYCSQCKFREL